MLQFLLDLWNQNCFAWKLKVEFTLYFENCYKNKKEFYLCKEIQHGFITENGEFQFTI